jgi:thioredoxin 1
MFQLLRLHGGDGADFSFDQEGFMSDVHQGEKRKSFGPGSRVKVIILIGLFVVAGAAFYFKSHHFRSNTQAVTGKGGSETRKVSVPRLVELGADRCIPCKMMAPILEELRKEYSGKLEVAFIDVWKNRDAARRYGIRRIPTQIFYDASGRELFRHVGFFPKEDILAKWKELGVPIDKGN